MFTEGTDDIQTDTKVTTNGIPQSRRCANLIKYKSACKHTCINVHACLVFVSMIVFVIVMIELFITAYTQLPSDRAGVVSNVNETVKVFYRYGKAILVPANGYYSMSAYSINKIKPETFITVSYNETGAKTVFYGRVFTTELGYLIYSSWGPNTYIFFTGLMLYVVVSMTVIRIWIL
jgi:hypothetical protein